MTSNNKKTLKEKIVDDLLITGFPLEVEVSNVLSKEEWRVETSPLYIDPDDQVTRELDIYSLKIYHKEPRTSLTNNISIFSHLIIQCKKSRKPWVFFDNARNDYYWLGFYSLKCDKNDFMSELCKDENAIGFTNHRYKDIKKHRSFHIFDDEPNKSGNKNKHSNNDIYEALITSCKALEYYKDIYSSGNTAHFFTPIVVLDGTLWSASLSKRSKIKLKKVSKLIVRFDYIFGNDKKPNKYREQFVEVITRKAFEKSINEIENDNTTLLKSWINFLNLPSAK